MAKAPGPASKLSPKEQKVKDYVYKQLRLGDARAQVKEKNPTWSDQQLKDAERWYRNFLWLAYRESRRGSRQILGIEPHADQFWHAHILDTENYATVCRNILGKGGFLHHKPPKNARTANAKVRVRSEAAYKKEFGAEFEVLIEIGPFGIPCFWHLVF